MRDRKRLACSIVLIVLSICLISCAFAACRHRHEYNLITTVNAPTCTTEGIGVYQCACGDTYEGAIDCLGHEYSQSYTVDIPATCLTYGQKSRHCIRCDDKSDIISALGEHYTVSEVPATCTQAGLSSYIDCPYCGLKQEPHVIPALSHDWQEEIISPASCKEEGAMLRTCRRDGCEVSNTIILPKTSHTWDTEHCCTVCGEILAVSDGLSYQEIYLDGDVACYLTSAGNAIDLHIVIPSYYNLLPVIGLADDAFRDMAITAITIPDSTVKIGKRALAGCNKLTKIIYSGTAAQWLSIDKGEAWDSGAGNYIVECLDETLDKYGEPLMWSITYTADPLHCENITYIHRDNLAMGDVSKITALPKLGYKFVCWSDGVNTPTRNDTSDSAGKSVEAIFTYDALAMPIIALDTLDDAPITSKEEYIRCSVDVIGAGQYDFIDASAKIRGRGNSTWTLDKKPYRLKFDAATDLFGNGAARDWTLIANHCDKSLVRNYLTYSLAELFETQKYTTTTQFVEVYLNGVYEGVYAVHEQTQTGAGRVEIDEDFDDNDISFLLELDERAYEEGVEGKDYFKVGGNLYAIKTPDTDLITPAQTSKIRAYL
ncbi:MAG: CotH kinase family protein, partial [Clostridia bacterium]|nr:CotH kinase family protein [Clostridia bacterium]